MDYFQIPEMPGVDRFACTRLHATLSVPTCTAMWRQGNGQGKPARRGGATHPLWRSPVLGEEDPAQERNLTCRGCPIGAAHAGIANASMSPIFGVLLCSRCHRGTSRLVCGVLCVSCKNREYEFLRGRNARGQFPTRLKPLAPRALAYWTDGRAQRLRRNLTVATTELLVDLLRDAHHQIIVGWRAQLRLSWRRRSGPSSRTAASTAWAGSSRVPVPG